MNIEGLSEEQILEIVDEIVSRGLIDWVHMPELDWLVKTNASRHGVDLDWSSRVVVGLEVLRITFEKGFMVPGDYTKWTNGFVPWELDHQKAIERIESNWRAIGEDIVFGDVCWFANTEAGNEYGKTVLDAVNKRNNWPRHPR